MMLLNRSMRLLISVLLYLCLYVVTLLRCLSNVIIRLLIRGDRDLTANDLAESFTFNTTIVIVVRA